MMILVELIFPFFTTLGDIQIGSSSFYPVGYESLISNPAPANPAPTFDIRDNVLLRQNSFFYFIDEAHTSATSTEPRLEYFGTDGFISSRQTSSDFNPNNYRRLRPYEFEKQGEVECLFDVPDTIPEDEESWLKACRNLEGFFPVRFSYHQGLEWNTAAKNIDGGAGYFPRNTFYGNDASYVNPIYFDKSTSTTNGHHYCEAHPLRGAVLGNNGRTDRAASCADLNAAIAPYLGTARITGTPAEFKDLTHQHGFVQYREGATDFYTCKWKAPMPGNFLDPNHPTIS